MAKHMYEDKLLKKLPKWRQGDADRASEAGEQREDIGDFLEQTGWNKKALSWIRSLDKLEQDKRDDILRSFDDLRAIMDDAVWRRLDTPDMFTEPEAAPAAALEEAPEPVTPFDPEVDEFERQVNDAFAGKVVNFASAAE